MHVYNVTQPPGPPGPPRPPQSSTVVKVASKVLSKVDLTATRSALLSPLSQLLPGEEEEYDPHKHRHVAKPTSYSETMTHLLKACFGAGMLAMPNAMYRLGLVFGTIGVFFLGFIATYCLEILVIAQYKLCKKKKVGYLSYPDAMRMALQEGPPFMRWSAGLFANAVDTFLMIWQIGVCSIFLVFVGENLRQFILYCGKDVPVRIVIACLYPFLAAMCMVKDLKLMAPLSTFSNVCNMAGVALVFYYLIRNDMEIDDSKYKLKSLMDIPVFVGTVLFAMEAVGVILALEHNMDNPKDFTGWCGLFSKGMIIICLVYLTLGIFGYLKYGDECQASVTLNLPQEDKKAQAAKLAFAASIFTTYPLQNFVAWQISWSYLEKKFSTEKKHTADLVMRVVAASVPFILALAAPTLGPFIGLVGSLCLSMVGILFPALMDVSVYYPNEYGVCSYKVFLDIIIMVLGVACCISGVYTSLLEMAQNLS